MTAFPVHMLDVPDNTAYGINPVQFDEVPLNAEYPDVIALPIQILAVPDKVA